MLIKSIKLVHLQNLYAENEHTSAPRVKIVQQKGIVFMFLKETTIKLDC